MPDFETELNRLRDQLTDVIARLIRVEVELQSVCHKLERHEDRHEKTNRQVPGTVISMIAVAISVIAVTVQIWMTR